MSVSAIRVLTLNCWGLKYVAKDRKERIRAIASSLAQSDYDIVALQELWVFSDYEYIRTSVDKRLPHAKFFYSGALGAGLAILSRFPIIAASIYPYSLNGHPTDLGAGDWMVGKAAASVVINHPVLGEAEVFNTHFIAKGGDVGPEHLRAHRMVNAWELSKLVRISASLGRYIIVAGDFNSIPTSLPMKIIRDYGGLLDAWMELHPDTDVIRTTSSPKNAIERYGVTADSPLNSYSAAKHLDPIARTHFGKRLDYIFYREPGERYLSERPMLKCSKSQVVFSDKVPGRSFSFSDHFGIEATIDIIPSYDSQSSTLRNALSRRSSWLTDDVLSRFVVALTACYRLSQGRSRLELTAFAACIVALIALCIGSAWLPHAWISPIFILFAVIISWHGTTMLYTGFIYGNWERRALMNVLEELELTRRSNTVSPASSTPFLANVLSVSGQ
ncbi:ISC1 [Sanghuangporus weigelae]